MAQATPVQLTLNTGSNFPASKKVYVPGSRPDIQVPFREVTLTPTSGRFGDSENPPVRLYDTSGPYTDPNAKLDVRQGLPPIRSAWILERGDVEEVAGVSSGANGKGRGEPFPGLKRRILKGCAGSFVPSAGREPWSPCEPAFAPF